MLAEILAALAIAILRYLQGREDIKAATRAKLIERSMEYAQHALIWKAKAAGDTHLPELVVRRPGLKLWVPGDIADSGGRPEAGAVPDPGSGRPDVS